ncbi:MAG: HNH endonuclease signature motif containing protein [Micropepsaceae bacterium]
MRPDAWTRDQIIDAIKLYCVTPFGRLHSGNQEIIALAKRLGRTPSALALKLVNFAALDTSRPQKGMSNYSKLDAAVWAEVFGNPDAYLPSADAHSPFVVAADGDVEDFIRRPEGRDVPVQSTARSGQQFFRSMIMTSYGSQCAMTDIDTPDLLVASHILPWAEEKAERTNPRNGLLLNRLHDRAFEGGHIVLDDELRVIFSPTMSRVTRDKLERTARSHLRLPERFAPDPAFLKRHRDYWSARWMSG